MYPWGEVRWEQKFRVKLSCSMDFTKMPYDEQQCEMRVLDFRDSYRASLSFHLRGETPRQSKAMKGQGCTDSGTGYIDIVRHDVGEGGSQEWRLPPQPDGITAAVKTRPAAVVFSFRLARRPGYYEYRIMAPTFFFVRHAMAWHVML